MECKNWEVGSTWFISPNAVKETYDGAIDIPAFHGEELSYVSTCRSAIGLALDAIGKKGVAFVPAFTCHTVVLPFEERGFEICAYPVNEGLSVDWVGFERLVEQKKPSVVIFHSYFGFNTIVGGDALIKKLREDGVAIIEDLTQSMFSTYQRINADYYLGSIRKWMPVPDGAFIKGNVDVKELTEDNELSEAKLDAMNAKGCYIVIGEGGKAEFMSKFKVAEELLDSRTKLYAISIATKTTYGNCDLGKFADVRRNNYKILAACLSKHPQLEVIFDILPDDVVPFMLPVLIHEDRKDFQQYIAGHNVYPTVIWACPDELKDTVSDAAMNVYNNIICFHCDQRYDEGDMIKVADIVDSYFGK